MNTKHEIFINDYLKHVINGDAAIFAGAGLSVGAGYVDWRSMLKDIAREIDLEVDRETDLIALAQFHVNERGGRGGINQKIIEEFKEQTELSENHKILARLPIRTYWTTNYDTLLEDSLNQEFKRVDVKYSVGQLASQLYKRSAVVYKMHGDVNHPQDAVITKDDYEQYHKKNEGFITTLSSDLISKTFLFIGFSFTDPNLDYILSRVKLILNSNTRPHYCLIKKTDRKDFSNDADFDYASRRQSLMISDLKRFQIQTVTVDHYGEITEILGEVEKRHKRGTVFISGSAHSFQPHDEQKALSFIHKLAGALVKQKYTIVNGFGHSIGSAVINGALEMIQTSPLKFNEDQLLLRPFPQVQTGESELNILKEQYRKKMISLAGIGVFIFGNKIDQSSKQVIDSPGVKLEFDIAIKKRVIPIPVGATGYQSRKLWEEVKNNFHYYYHDFPHLKGAFERLGDENVSLDEQVQLIIKIVNMLNSK